MTNRTRRPCGCSPERRAYCSEWRRLAEELLAYEIEVDPDGDAKFGAFKVGRHDDLVTALGLAVQEKPRRFMAY